MNALEKINIAILLVTISYIIAINSVLNDIEEIDPVVRWFFTFLTSFGLFRMLILLIYWIIRNSDTLLALHYRGRFLKGIWTYHYDVEGEVHLGIWRISQDLSAISITGYGVDSTGKIDTHFRSISQIFEHQGVDEIMFTRTDTRTGDEHFSKVTLYVDRLSRPNWRSGPTFMRAQSVLYGYEEAGVRHADIILTRVEDQKGEAQIIEEMCQPKTSVRALPSGGQAAGA